MKCHVLAMIPTPPMPKKPRTFRAVAAASTASTTARIKSPGGRRRFGSEEGVRREAAPCEVRRSSPTVRAPDLSSRRGFCLPPHRPVEPMGPLADLSHGLVLRFTSANSPKTTAPRRLVLLQVDQQATSPHSWHKNRCVGHHLVIP